MLRNAGGSEDPMLRDMARQLAAWDFTGVTLTPPTTLIEDRLALDLDGIAVHLIYVGPAHTAGDVIVHLPAARVVFTGDILFRLCTPIGWEGTYERWIAALDTIVALDPAVVVPGHGPLSGLEGPREMQAYLRYVRAEAKRWFDAGLPTLEAARRIDLGPYAGWTEPERILFQRGARVPRAARRAARRADRRDRALPRHVRAARVAAGGGVGFAATPRRRSRASRGGRSR